MRPVRSDN